MRILKSIIATGVGVLVMLLAAGLVHAQQGHGMGMHQGQGVQGQMSAEQLEELRELRVEFGQEMYEARSELHGKYRELGLQMAGEEVDTGQVRSLVREINELRGELFSTRVDMYLQMRERELLHPYSGFGTMGPGRMGMGGHGMMGAPGMGQGMMRGMCPMMQGMGPGMMHGPGMGQGMMHGPGMGPGMMHGPGMGQGW